jgi:phosphate transport system substrate-binding protein
MTPTLLSRTLVAGLLAWFCCGPAQAEELAVPGSGNPEYALSALAQAFNAKQGQHHVTVPSSSGTAGALRDVGAGSASLGRVGRRLTDAERAAGLAYLPLGRDAVVFAAGAGVTVRSITQDQALEIYRGSLSDWRALGGKPGPIRAIGREASDASRQAINRVMTPFTSLVFADSVKVVLLDPQMIELLDRYATSFGFLNRSALLACKTPLVVLALDGVAPTAQNLEQGRYPLWLEIGLVYRPARLSAAAKAFIEFVQSPAGQAVLRELGVVPAAAGR